MSQLRYRELYVGTALIARSRDEAYLNRLAARYAGTSFLIDSLDQETPPAGRAVEANPDWRPQ